MRLVLGASLAGVLMFVAAPASAAHYLFSLTGSGFSASGTLTTDDSTSQANPYPCGGCASGLGYLVTAVTGTINGASITGVAPLGAVAGNNNRLYTTAPYLDWGDLGFQTAAHLYNVFDGTYANRSGQFLAVDNGPVYANPVSFSLQASVPEPASWSMMVGGLGLAGTALRLRRRQERVCG